jgi:hypothetical protein
VVVGQVDGGKEEFESANIFCENLCSLWAAFCEGLWANHDLDKERREAEEFVSFSAAVWKFSDANEMCLGSYAVAARSVARKCSRLNQDVLLNSLVPNLLELVRS